MKHFFKLSLFGVFATFFFSFFPPNDRVTFYGDFKSIKMETYFRNILQSTFYNGFVKLYPLEVDERMPFKALNLGIVKINNKTLKYQPNIKAYIDSIERKTDEGVLWSVSSNSVFAAFTQSCSANYPVFNGIQNIPDTISKTRSYVIHLNGLQNSDFVEFVLDDNVFHPSVPWYRKMRTTPQNSVLTIPGHNFNAITVQQAFVRLVFTKAEDVIIAGKKFHFENRLMMVKSVVIIN